MSTHSRAPERIMRTALRLKIGAQLDSIAVVQLKQRALLGLWACVPSQRISQLSDSAPHLLAQPVWLVAKPWVLEKSARCRAHILDEELWCGSNR